MKKTGTLLSREEEKRMGGDLHQGGRKREGGKSKGPPVSNRRQVTRLTHGLAGEREKITGSIRRDGRGLGKRSFRGYMKKMGERGAKSRRGLYMSCG